MPDPHDGNPTPENSAPPGAAVDLLIAGAGPVGLFAAYYAGFRGLTAVVIEALPMAGGQIAAFYPEKLLYDVPGFEAVRGSDLVRRLEAQARAFPIDFRFREEIVAITAADEGLAAFTVPSRSGAGNQPRLRHTARAILLTLGIGRLAPQRRRDEFLHGWEGRGVDYDGGDPPSYAGRRVLVVGGSTQAVEVALAHAEARAETVLVHRRDRLTIDEDTRARLTASGVSFVPFHDVVDLAGSDRVERVVLADTRDGRRREVSVDAVLPCYGFVAEASLVQSLEAAVTGDAIEVDAHMASSRPGVFAAGDAATHPGKVRVLAAEFGEACTAVNNIAHRFVPGASLFPGYSSHRKEYRPVGVTGVGSKAPGPMLGSKP